MRTFFGLRIQGLRRQGVVKALMLAMLAEPDMGDADGLRMEQSLTLHALGVVSVALDFNGCLEDVTFHPHTTGGLAVVVLADFCAG